MDITDLSSYEAPSPNSNNYNPRKRGRTACTRCKTRKQKCDNEYPVCSNCRKAGVGCDKSSVRREHGNQNAYTSALEERIAYLEGKLAQSEVTGASSHIGSGASQPVTSMPSPENQERTRTNNASGFDNNAVGDLVGFLALSSSEAPAYVGSSSGISLAVNLGEMVQASVWNPILSPWRTQLQQNIFNDSTGPEAARRTRGIPPQPDNANSNIHDRPQRVESIVPNTAEPPNDEMGARMLDAYLTRLHVRYPFLDRTELWRLHGERWQLARAKREELSKSERFGIFKLYLVYAIGATLIQLSENHRFVPAEKFYMTAIQQLPDMCESRSVENIEAMTLLVVYHLRSASSNGMWYMTGLAMRTAIDIGLHRKANELNLDPFTAQMRRRLFWTVYYLERVVSMSLGRPFSIADRHIDVELPLDINDDVRDPAKLNAPQPLDKITTMTFAIYMIRLRRIDSRIQHKIYRADRPLHSLRSKMDKLYLELEEWKLSAKSRFNEPDIDYPIFHYNKTVLLLIQPFLPLLSITDPYYYICLRATGDICQTHKRLHQTPEYGHSFIAVQTVFMAGITLLYALWTHTDQVWSVQMSNDIRACSTVLFVMGERAAWVKKYRDAFELLVNAAMEKLQRNDTAKTVGMAELMTAQYGGANLAGSVPGMASAGNIPRAEEVPDVALGLDPGKVTQPERYDHGVRMALQLAPWIDQDENSPLWMPDFEMLESLSGDLWNYGNPTPFESL